MIRGRGILFVAAALAGAALVTAAAPIGSARMDAQGNPPPQSVAVIGDFGSGTDAERQVADLIARADPRAVVTTGDNVYGDRGYERLVGDYYGRWVAARSLLPAAGNHDHEEGIAAFDAYFPYLEGRHVYAAGRGGIRFFFLDSTVALESSNALARQRAWLEHALRSSQARWKVVVLHHPPFSSSSVHGSTEEFRWPYRSWGADLVLSGHDHDYERVVEGGMTYVVSGAGGKDLYAFGDALPGSRARVDDRFGALFLMPSMTALVGEFRSAQGERLDRFVIAAGRSSLRLG